MNALELINFGSKVLKKNSILTHKLDSEILLSQRFEYVPPQFYEKLIMNRSKIN